MAHRPRTDKPFELTGTARYSFGLMGANANAGLSWLVFALLTVVSWGVYGVFLHTGQTSMQPGGDPNVARYKAFLFVGLAYFLTAVLAPLALLIVKGAAWTGYTPKGMAWSLIAGIVGAIGAFGVLLAFGAGGIPGVVMSIVFAGAPVVNAVLSLYLYPPAGGMSRVPWQFFVGILLAAMGGFLVMYFKPPPAPHKPAAVAGVHASAVNVPTR